jgi:DNA-binding NtrC family response regulator
MTAFGAVEKLREAERSGVEAVLTKPFDLDSAVRVVESAWH